MVDRAFSAANQQQTLDSNGSAIHLKGVAPVVMDILVYMHVVSATPDVVTVSICLCVFIRLSYSLSPQGYHPSTTVGGLE